MYEGYSKRFISFEGGEGAGKSSLVKALSQKMNDAGIETIHTREPGGCPQAEAIRNLLVTGETTRWVPDSELLLFTAARREHLDRTVIPALEKDMVVLCDRYIDSSIVYQGIAHQVSAETVLGLHGRFCHNLMPGLTFVLDVEPETGLKRSLKQSRDLGTEETRFEGLDIAYHRRVNSAFRSLPLLDMGIQRNFDVIESELIVSLEAMTEIVGNKLLDYLNKE